MPSLQIVSVLSAAIIGCSITWATAATTPPVDPMDRDDVVRYFHEVYLESENYASHHGWTGNVRNCNAGTLSSAIQDDVIRRINYFRAMAGLPAEITLSDTLNKQCQQAALMMAYHHALNHNPPTSWACYTAGGAEAASQSNLSLGTNTPFYGPQALTGQVEDLGDSNTSVSHRRWILFTRAPDQMGHGSIPLSPRLSNSSDDNCSMALWVTGPSTSELADEFRFVAWPPEGFVPSSLAFERWSFGLADDAAYSPDFTSATVTMVRDGAQIPLDIVYRGKSPTVADPTIVWEVSGFPMTTPPTTDQTYTVTVSGIIGAAEESYSYEVTVINENVLTPILLSGSSNAYIGHDNVYQFEPISGAQAYQLRVAATSAGDWIEGAETSPAPVVIDNTHPNYPLTVTTLSATGSRSFHLLEQQDIIEIDREILPSTDSRLTFRQRFRYMGTGTYLGVEIETSPGNWVEVWKRYGRHSFNVIVGDWDRSWSSESIPIGSYAGGTLRVRFRYVYESGADWTPIPSDNPNDLGAFVDNVRVTNSSELVGESFVSVAATATSVTFNPEEPGEFWLQLSPQVADESFGFGPETIVSAVTGSPPSMAINTIGIDAGEWFFIEIESSGYQSFTVSSSSNGGAVWQADTSFVETQPATGRRRFTAPLSGPHKIYRVTATE